MITDGHRLTRSSRSAGTPGRDCNVTNVLDIAPGIAPPMFDFWLALFGPRPTFFSFTQPQWSLIIPGLCHPTLIHGALIGWYRILFLNVEKLGYGTVGINLVVVITMAAMPHRS